MKQFFLSVAVMLAASTMSVKAQGNNYNPDYNNRVSTSQFANNVEKETTDWENDWRSDARTWMLAIDRWLMDHPEDTERISNLHLAKSVIKFYYDANNGENMKELFNTLRECYPDVWANVMTELAK